MKEQITSTPRSLSQFYYNIYNKTADIVNYKTERNRFEELSCFLRNNPTGLDQLKREEEKTVGKPAQKESALLNKTTENIISIDRVNDVLSDLAVKYYYQIEVAHARLQVIDEIKEQLGI